MNKYLFFILNSLVVLCVASDYNAVQKILHFGVHSNANNKPQEDRFSVTSLNNKNIKNFFVVCDGHGGYQVAQKLVQDLPVYFHQYVTTSQTKEEALRRAFQKVEDSITSESGAVAVAGYFGKHHAHIAWVGDTRMVCKSCATKDHTLARQDEWERICNAQGVIFRMMTRTGAIGPWRINGLIPTRSIGDRDEKGAFCDARFMFKRSDVLIQLASDATKWPSLTVLPLSGQVIATPEYIQVDLNEDNDLFIFATDGLWDVVSNEEALDLVKTLMNKKDFSMNDVAKGLVDTAIVRGSKDNITAVIVSVFSDLVIK